jgi:acyl-CoA thioesterase
VFGDTPFPLWSIHFLIEAIVPLASDVVGANPWESTEVSRVGEGCYSATISRSWNLAVAAQGGVVAAIAARAMEAELGTGQSLRSFHGVFASPVPVGPVEVEVGVIRSGRSISQVQATVRPVGAPAGFTALAAFGQERPGFSYTELEMPRVPPPEECGSFRDPPPPESDLTSEPLFEFWRDVIEGRPALGHAPWDTTERGAAEVATWIKFEHPPTEQNGQFDPLALLVAADMMPAAVFEKVGPAERDWFAPSVDLTVHLNDSPTGPWILNHNRAHFANDGYASAEVALWDPHAPDGPRLLAWATQVMFFTQLT